MNTLYVTDGTPGGQCEASDDCVTNSQCNTSVGVCVCVADTVAFNEQCVEGKQKLVQYSCDVFN